MRFLAIALAVALLSAPTSARPEPLVLPEVKNDCATKWPGDYSMQKYCIKKEMDAALEVLEIKNIYGEDSEEEAILMRCMDKWFRPRNAADSWSMTWYCWKKQFKAYKSLQ